MDNTLEEGMLRRRTNRHLHNNAVFVFFCNVLEKVDKMEREDNKKMDIPLVDTYLEPSGPPRAVVDNAYKDIDS